MKKSCSFSLSFFSPPRSTTSRPTTRPQRWAGAAASTLCWPSSSRSRRTWQDDVSQEEFPIAMSLHIPGECVSLCISCTRTLTPRCIPLSVCPFLRVTPGGRAKTPLLMEPTPPAGAIFTPSFWTGEFWQCSECGTVRDHRPLVSGHALFIGPNVPPLQMENESDSQIASIVEFISLALCSPLAIYYPSITIRQGASCHALLMPHYVAILNTGRNSRLIDPKATGAGGKIPPHLPAQQRRDAC